MGTRIEIEMLTELIKQILESCEDDFGKPAKVTQPVDDVLIVDFKDEGRFSVVIKAIDLLN